MSGTVTDLGVVTLGSLNTALASTALPLINDLLALLDTLLSAPISLGSLRNEIGAQLTGLLQATLTINVTTPITFIQNLLNQLAATIASLKAALVTAPTVSVGMQATALAAAAANLQLKIAALDALLALLNRLKGLASSTYATLFAKMATGGLALYAMEGPAATVGNDVAATISLGISGGTGPGSTVRGILILMEDPVAFATFSSVLKTT